MATTSNSRAAQIPPLVAVTPSDTLVFKLVKDSETKTFLTVKNVSSSKIVFKVKTTQPSWYYVRPNQQILTAGQSEEVAIVLVESEANRFLDLAAEGNAEKLDKHRFLVQSKALEDDEFSRIQALPQAQRGEEYSKIWGNTPKDDRKNLKLKVEFIYPDFEERSKAPVGASVPEERGTLSQNVEIIRNRLARKEDAPGTSQAGGEEVPASPEAVFAELLQLRKKYDAVVEYTVHLTAERDQIVAQLDDLQREYSREVNRKKPETPKGSGGKADKATEKKATKGFSLLAIIVAVILAYILGRYLRV